MFPGLRNFPCLTRCSNVFKSWALLAESRGEDRWVSCQVMIPVLRVGRGCGQRKERGLGNLAIGRKMTWVGEWHLAGDDHDVIRVLILDLRVAVRNRVSWVRATAWCPICKLGGLEFALPNLDAHLEALPVGPGLSPGPCVLCHSQTPLVLLVTRGTSPLPLGLCLLCSLPYMGEGCAVWTEERKSTGCWLLQWGSVP